MAESSEIRTHMLQIFEAAKISWRLSDGKEAGALRGGVAGRTARHHALNFVRLGITHGTKNEE